MLAKIDPARTKVLRKGAFSGKSVLYWMSRDKRVDDNWALLAAQSVALNNKVPLIVCFQYLGHFPEANIRQYGFPTKGVVRTKEKTSFFFSSNNPFSWNPYCLMLASGKCPRY